MEVFSTLPHPVSFATIQRPSARAHGALGKSPALRSVEPPAEVKMEECVIWYLGDEGRGSVNLQMTHAANPVRLLLNTSVRSNHSDSCRGSDTDSDADRSTPSHPPPPTPSHPSTLAPPSSSRNACSPCIPPWRPTSSPSSLETSDSPPRKI